MLPGLEMLSCPNLAVPVAVMQHVVDVESSHNPFAIGVVGGQLARQPQNLGEAIATVRMLEEQGYNFSVGIAQVNRANLAKYGLDTYEKAFEACANLAAGSRILAECYASSGNDWGKAFSCYHSGNFITGYRDGYVQKIYDSISRSLTLEGRQVAAVPVALTRDDVTRVSKLQNDSGAYRIAMRSIALDTALSVVPSTMARTAGVSADSPSNDAATATLATGHTAASDVFVPQVLGPDEPVTRTSVSSPAVTSTASPEPADLADSYQEPRDEAFVF
ncbi:lytic transglycosylase domain-containing protein [Dyella sp.]|uniref:lytic transglycosylase domain-containing protein n=1 Tax=Dyella sp. TaxID=1869338 RepID=UPI002B4766EE|nr:lytic transglycosylase domain-containing protein [Dyella sp.]HKT29214.1 lytic transglycosylase domain-containing protein [Dyella sp.]